MLMIQAISLAMVVSSLNANQEEYQQYPEKVGKAFFLSMRKQKKININRKNLINLMF